MARPRQIRPGTPYMITRRCVDRRFFLKPCPATNAIFRYCLARAATKTGVLLHAACVMSDHVHLVVTDVEGRLPEFTRELHRLTAKAINATRGRWECVWSPGRCRLDEIHDDQEMIDRIAYVAANPVRAGLVASPEEWPGVLYVPGAHDHVERVGRPSVYFGESSIAPAALQLRITPPAGVVDLAERIASAIERVVAASVEKMRKEGRKFLGRAAVLATPFLARASSFEVRRSPVAKLPPKRDEFRLRRWRTNREFQRAYRDSRERWRDGERDVVFPFGTWWMRVFHGVATAAPEGAVAAA